MLQGRVVKKTAPYTGDTDEVNGAQNNINPSQSGK